MREIEALGIMSVRRGCAFAALAIGTLMFGYLDRPAASLGIGALCTMLAAAVLLLLRSRVQRADYRQTELWMLLPENKRPPAAIASHLIPRILAEIYLAHSRIAAAISAILGAFAIGCRIVE